MAETKQIKNIGTPKLAKSKTQSLPKDETKQIKMSKTRAKKCSGHKLDYALRQVRYLAKRSVGIGFA